MKKKSLVADLVKALKNDKEYRYGWVANIAMAQLDCERWYRERTGKRYLNYTDRHTIANEAAEHFLKLLCAQSPEVQK